MTAGSNKTNKKGFSGLSDLVSEVSEIDTFATSEPKAERKHSGPEEQLPQEIPPADPVQEATNVSPSSENMSPGKSGDGSGSKLIFGILAVLGIVFVFWIAVKFFIFFCILKRIRPKLPKSLAIIKI